MSSGYYPIGKYDGKAYELLKQAIENINEAREYIGIAEDQSDNAASDGAYDYRLSLAEDLIAECIKSELEA